MNEKEQLKKMLFTYGFGRWNKIRKNSQELNKKSDAELQGYSIAFIKTILEYLNFENAELKKHLLSIVENNASDNFYVPAKPSLPFPNHLGDWGELLKHKAAPWGKRIQLLHRIQIIVKAHKKAHKQLKSKYSKEENKEEKEKLATQLKSFGTLFKPP
eukprot:TRINITY_DN13323_c0_g1_i1.p2 TRINITY_DN13323_c0_g1~~TRINITY_DN13323_c0_g1_i1.p2  ORF type:complete len:158 (-),score=41.71 TRINITY_DN13323_c0_g1_i1:99-572(-)